MSQISHLFGLLVITLALSAIVTTAQRIFPSDLGTGLMFNDDTIPTNLPAGAAVTHFARWASDWNFTGDWPQDSLEYMWMDSCVTRDKIVLYANFIVALAKEKGMVDCDVNSSNNLCNKGSNFIRDEDNWASILGKYTYWMQKMSEFYQDPAISRIVVLIEPNFLQYSETGSSISSFKQEGGGIPDTDMVLKFLDIKARIKDIFPKAFVGIDLATWFNLRYAQFYKNFIADPEGRTYHYDLLFTSGAPTIPTQARIRADPKEKMTWNDASLWASGPILTHAGYDINGDLDDSQLGDWFVRPTYQQLHVWGVRGVTMTLSPNTYASWYTDLLEPVVEDMEFASLFNKFYSRLCPDPRLAYPQCSHCLAGVNYSKPDCTTCKPGYSLASLCTECTNPEFTLSSDCRSAAGECIRNPYLISPECTICKSGANFVTPTCYDCKPGFSLGTGCQSCLNQDLSPFDNCEIPKCQNTKLLPPSCTLCTIGQNYAAPDCTVCKTGYSIETECTSCTNRSYSPETGCQAPLSTSPICPNPDLHFPQCVVCSKGQYYEAPDCTKCVAGYDLSSNCQTCSRGDTWTGDNCDQCTGPRLTVENNCNCVNTNLLAPECTACSKGPQWVAPDCNTCTDPQYLPENDCKKKIVAPGSNALSRLSMVSVAFMIGLVVAVIC